MAKQFDDIKRVKVGATVVAPIAPQSAPVSRLFANPFAKENGTVAPKPFSETVREIKPGFFVPRAALPQRLENETAKKTGETRTPPPARSSQDYFSSLSSHSVHVARANFSANGAPPARMILSGNAKMERRANRGRDRRGRSTSRFLCRARRKEVFRRSHFFPSSSLSFSFRACFSE